LSFLLLLYLLDRGGEKIQTDKPAAKLLLLLRLLSVLLDMMQRWRWNKIIIIVVAAGAAGAAAATTLACSEQPVGPLGSALLADSDTTRGWLEHTIRRHGAGGSSNSSGSVLLLELG
jgi:hypothetical protein